MKNSILAVLVLLMLSVLCSCTKIKEEEIPDFDPAVYFHEEDYWNHVYAGMFTMSYTPELDESGRKQLYAYLKDAKPGYLLKNFSKKIGGYEKVMEKVVRSYTVEFYNKDRTVSEHYAVFEYDGKSYMIDPTKFHSDRTHDFVGDYLMLRADKGLYDFLYDFINSPPNINE